MKKIILSIALLLVVLISGCDKLEESEFTTPMDVNIEGYIYDGVSEVPIEGAVISGKFGSTKTNSKGYYAINGLDMGTYKFIIEVEGYMAKVITPTLVEKEEDFKGNNLNELIETDMYMANQPISTQLLQVSGPIAKPLSGLPYIIELNSNFRDRFVYGTTDANGMITDTIPNNDFTIVIDTIIENVLFTLDQYVSSPLSISKQYVVALTDLSVSPIFMVSTNLVDEDGNSVVEFVSTSSIVVDFNQALNSDESIITLEKYVGGSYYDIKIDISYQDENKRVVLSPAADGKLSEGQQYRLNVQYVEALSNASASYSETIDFRTLTTVSVSLDYKPEIFKLKSPSIIGEYTTLIDAQLTVDINSSYVEVYGRYENDEEYVMFHTEYCNWTDHQNGIIMMYNISLGDFPGIEIPAAGMFSGGNDFELMFRTYTYSNGEKVYSDYSDVERIYNDMPMEL